MTASRIEDDMQEYQERAAIVIAGLTIVTLIYTLIYAKYQKYCAIYFDDTHSTMEDYVVNLEVVQLAKSFRLPKRGEGGCMY